MIKVSIIIPLYNTEKYVDSALKSALNQNYKDIEVIVVDDGSTDRSIDVCRQIEDSRLKIVQQENRGLSGARNTGIRQAKGEYIAFLDADDLWLPDKISKHVDHLTNSPEVGASFSYSRFIDESDKPLGIYQFSKTKNITPLDILCRTPIGNGSAAVFRKAVFQAIEFETERNGVVEKDYFDEDFRESQDVECWMRMAIQTDWQIEGIPEVLTLYRVNSKGISANLTKKIKAWDRLIDKIYTYAPRQMAKWEKPAVGYHLRHLARRAVTLQDKEEAVKLFMQSVSVYWPILLEEPKRTGMTGAAAVLLWILPKPLYTTCSGYAMKLTGENQKRRFKDSLGF